MQSCPVAPADLAACGSNQNYPLIDYLLGSRKAIMDLILNLLKVFKVCLSAPSKSRFQRFTRRSDLSCWVRELPCQGGSQTGFRDDSGKLQVEGKGDLLQWVPDAPQFQLR